MSTGRRYFWKLMGKIAPCRCTRAPARLALYHAFGNSFLEHRVGSVFDL
ncbi:MAG: hypothetical protein AB1767_04060 [Bacillota bacterium]